MPVPSNLAVCLRYLSILVANGFAKTASFIFNKVRVCGYVFAAHSEGVGAVCVSNTLPVGLNPAEEFVVIVSCQFQPCAHSNGSRYRTIILHFQKPSVVDAEGYSSATKPHRGGR